MPYKTKVLHQIRKLNQAYKKYAKAAGGKGLAKRQLNEEFQRFINIIDDEWSESLDSLMSTARETIHQDGEKFNQHIQDHSDDILVKEWELMRESKASLIDIEKLYAHYIRNQDLQDFNDQNLQSLNEQVKSVRTTEELLSHLKQLHQYAIEQIEISRTLNKETKKPRKRQVLRGTCSSMYGVGLIIANTYSPPLATFSYAVGAASLGLAVRDFAGEA